MENNNINIKQVTFMEDFIANSLGAVDNDKVKERFTKFLETVKVAKQHMADNAEKQAWLNYVLCDKASILVTYLFRHQLLTPEIEAEFRKIELAEDALAKARSYAKEDEEKMAELNKAGMEISNRRDGIDVFKTILDGKTPEEAKQMMEAYKERQEKVARQLQQQIAAQPPVMG